MKDFLPFYKGKKVLVVGAGGHIGGWIVEKLSAVDCQLTMVFHSQPKPTPKKGTVLVLDITNPGIWPELVEKADIIFQLAAHESSAVEPELDLKVNALSVLQMLEAAREKKVYPKIIFASSSNLVGLVEHLPVDESFKDNPLTIYAIHKLMAENYLRLYANEWGIPSIILRLANVYGPGVNLKEALHSTLNRMMQSAVLGKGLKLFSNKEKVRDFLYVDDAVEAFLAAGEVNGPKGDVYIVGSEQGQSFEKIAAKIGETVSGQSGQKVEIISDEIAPIKPVEMREFVANSARFKKLTGWSKQFDLEQGINKTAEYLKTHGS